MPRTARVDVAGHCYHVLNRANARYRIFRKDEDFEAFERVLAEAVVRAGDSGGSVSLLAYCVMGNHWHLVLRTHEDGAMGRMMKWLTTTHAGRYRVAHRASGGQSGVGHLYQGRYKSFLIEGEAHLLTVCRYVERNAVRAGLVPSGKAEDWRWSSLHRWRFGDDEAKSILRPWPVTASGLNDERRFNRPKQWLRTVNTPINEAELEALRTAAQRGRPYGSAAWVERMVKRHGLASTVRSPGRPRNEEERT
ncbi:MAG: transposase [Planctomycetota bacterium]